MDFDLIQARQALPRRAPDTHKRRGEVLIIAGSVDYPGAALLCARAAYRSGAGFVRLALPKALALSAAMALPEVVVEALPSPEAPMESDLDALLPRAAGAHAVVVGPGLGRRPGTLALVAALWKRLPQPAVFDADALFALPLRATPAGPRVLTPHEGELKQLMGAEALREGRVAAVVALAAAAQSVALLKGPGTLVAGPDGALSRNPTGNPALATAGTGDVLAGVIAALMAQGARPFAAAALGAWAHGLAADQWVEKNAGRGLLASDLIEELPRALGKAGA